MRNQLAIIILSTIPSVIGQINQICPSPNDNEICFTLNIPTDVAKTGNGAINFQISASQNYSWIALGQGKNMTNAAMYIIYTNADGLGLTLSPRSSAGHYQPVYNSRVQFTLRDGTGLVDELMVANIQCTNCNTWPYGSMNVSSEYAGSWIYAAKKGDPINSNDLNANLVQHEDYGAFTFNWSLAVGDATSNPFGKPLSATTSATGTSTSRTVSASSTTTTASTSSTTTTAASKAGLSKGAKAGIGVGVPVAVLIVIIVAVAMLLRFRREKIKPRNPNQEEFRKAELHGEAKMPEELHQGDIKELPGDEICEMGNNASDPVELPG